jgi:hypothetical protein
VHGPRINDARDVALVLRLRGAYSGCPLLNQEEEVPRVVRRLRDDLVSFVGFDLPHRGGRAGEGDEEEEGGEAEDEEESLGHGEQEMDYEAIPPKGV